jgi:hypothetical protein
MPGCSSRVLYQGTCGSYRVLTRRCSRSTLAGSQSERFRGSCIRSRLPPRSLARFGPDPIWWTPGYANCLTCRAFFTSFSSYSTGGVISEARVAVLPIVPDFEEFEDVAPCLVPRRPVSLMHEFHFEGGKETLRHGVVPTVSGSCLSPHCATSTARGTWPRRIDSRDQNDAARRCSVAGTFVNRHPKLATKRHLKFPTRVSLR